MKQMSFFHEDDRLVRLSEMGDPLEKIAAAVNWELFRPMLNKAFRKKSKGPGGRPPYDYVMMFKILLLQMWYGIADDNTEYLINDRLSFQRFLGLTLGDKVPDSKTIWLFRETLSTSGAEKALFMLFAKQMEAQGVITRNGSIVDASFVEAPRQRNTREENKEIKEGKIPINLDLDRQLYPFATPSQLDDHVRQCVEALYLPQGGLGINLELNYDVPLRNMAALLDAVRKYRTYRG